MKIIEYLPDPFIHALAWSLLHSLWQLLAIALLWQVSLKVAAKAPALVRQNLSIAALLTIPVVFTITFIKQYTIYSRVSRIAFIEYDPSTVENLTTGAGSWYVLQKDDSLITQLVDQNTAVIFWLYWIGIGLFSLYSVYSYSRVYHIRKNSLIALPHQWAESIEKAYRQTGISKKIPLWLSPNVSVPVVVGFFKPIVLLPLSISSSLTMKEVEDILLHEFYHIRCRDYNVNALQNVLEILFFYHPCTWWISATLRSQRESKVDEWIVRLTNQPYEYASTLLSLEEKRITNLQASLAATSSKSSLLIRIKNIMHMKTRNFKPSQKIAAILVIVLATVSLAWLNPPTIFYGYQDSAQQTQNLLAQATQQEPATPRVTPANPTPPSDPQRIVLEDGDTISWSELSEEDKEEIKAAVREAGVAVRMAMEEVERELNSEEFRQEMEEAQQEIREAMKEVHRELNSPEFKAEMQKAREEIKTAMEEVHQHLNSEEFKAEMQNAREEIRRAMQEVQINFDSEEFRREMEDAREEIRNALKEADPDITEEELDAQMKEINLELEQAMTQLDSVDWAQLGQGLNVVFEEVGKTFEIIGPTLSEIFKNFSLTEPDSTAPADSNQ